MTIKKSIISPHPLPASVNGSRVQAGGSMESVSLCSIGTIHTPFSRIEGMPIQPNGAEGLVGEIVLEDSFQPGLRDLEGFSHLILIYHLNRMEGYTLEVKPFLDTETHGIFATRSPRRPNHLGLSVVRLISIEDSVIRFANPDMLDGTPLLDIKPYVAEFDRKDPEREGWFAGKSANARIVRSDTRFS